jgi:hypothetical protein
MSYFLPQSPQSGIFKVSLKPEITLTGSSIMRKVIKIIPVFSLWLACLALVSHLMIPHDHHLTETYTPQEESCPVSNENTGHQQGFPVHCHAFNVSDLQRAVIYILIKENQSDDISSIEPQNAFVSGSGDFHITLFDTGKFFTDSYFLELSSLRAPPSIS